LITANDRASGVIGGLAARVQSLGGQMNAAQGSSANLGDSIAAGFLKAQAAIGIVQMGYGQLKGLITESSSLQLENMNSAQTFASLTGKSFDEGAEFIDRLNDRLSKSAAALPGATKDYTTLARTIQDNVLGAFKDADGKVGNMKGFEDTVAGISESYGVLAAASGVPIQNVGLSLTKAMGGASVAELRQLQFFEGNQAVLGFIESELKKVNAKSLKDLDEKSRVALIDQAGKKFVTEDLKRRAASSVDGLMQSFKSAFFDPSSGVFGFMRDLDPNVKGKQSAFTAFNELLITLIGGGGLLSGDGPVASILATLGLTVDPMVLLKNGFDFINSKLKGLVGFLTEVAGALKSGDMNLGDVIKSNWGIIQNSIGSFFEGIGEKAAGFLNGLVNGGANFVGQIDWGIVGNSIGLFLSSFMTELGGFFGNLDWKVYLIAAVPLIAGGLIMALAPAIVTTMGAAVVGFLALLTGPFALVAIGAVAGFMALLGFITANWDNLSLGVNQTMADLGGFFQWGLQGIINAWNTIISIPVQLIEWLGTSISTGITMISTKVTEVFTWIGNAISSILNNPAVKAVTGAVGGVADAVTNPVAAVTGAVGNVVSAVTNPAATATAIGGGVADAAATIGNLFGFGGVGAQFRGYIPNAANGLMGAAISEARSMPSGASLAVANTSEAILTPSMLSNLVNGAVSMGARSGGGTFAPQIIVNASGDAQAIAAEVMRLIQLEFSEYQAGQLA
jgi:hypothetical protein